jgi:hypothetical protein
MKKVLVVAVLVMVAAVYIPAAGAGEFFNAEERQEICRVVAEVFPGVDVFFHDTCNGDTSLLIGPMPTGELLFIFVRASGEVFTYQPPVRYEWASLQICKAIYLVMGFWDVQRALGPGPKELRGEKE